MMKKILTIFLLASLSLLVACSGNEDEVTTNNTNDFFFRCKIDGQDFEVNGVFAQFTDVSIAGIRTITITGVKQTGEQIGINLIKNAGDGEDISNMLGAYVFGGFGTNLKMASYVLNDISFTTSYGEVGDAGGAKLDLLNEDVAEGTFSFTARDENGNEVEITEGSFRATTLL